MRHIKVAREYIVELIVRAGQDLESILENREIDRWVKDLEGKLQECYYFYPLLPEQRIYASEQIRRDMEGRFF